MIPSRARLLSLVCVAACGGAAVPEPAPPPPASSVASPLPESPTLTPAIATPPPPRSPFHLVANLAGETHVHLVGNTVYVSGPAQDEGDPDHPSDALTAEITSSGLTRVPPASPHTLWWGFVNTIAGAPAGDAFMAWSTDNGRLARTAIYRRTAGAWVEDRSHEGLLLGGLAPWTEDTTLALFYGVMHQSAWGQPRLEVMGKKRASVPKLTRGEGKCGTLAFPTNLAALATGEVFTLGWRCKPGGDQPEITDEPVVEMWAPGETKSRVFTLPVKTHQTDDGAALVARSPTEVYALVPSEDDKQGRLLRFDGARWKPATLPGGAHPSALRVARDGSLWAVVSEKLWTLPAGSSEWSRVPLPDDAWKVASLAARSSEEVYVTTTTGELLATSLSVAAPPPPKAPVVARSSRRVLLPATKGCTSIFAVLFAFTKVTPPDYDFPLTRKALKGKTKLSNARLVVTEDGGRKFFGAIAPDLATGNALIDAVKKGVVGSAPALVCLDPKVVSEFPFDFATGERKRLARIPNTAQPLRRARPCPAEGSAQGGVRPTLTYRARGDSSVKCLRRSSRSRCLLSSSAAVRAPRAAPPPPRWVPASTRRHASDRPRCRARPGARSPRPDRSSTSRPRRAGSSRCSTWAPITP